MYIFGIMISFKRMNLRFYSTNNNIKEAVHAGLKPKELKTNMPTEMENPFRKEKRKCILCKYEIKPHYTNVRLLSQFVSRFTGKVYGRHITGLCAAQQANLEAQTYKAIDAGLMAAYYRDPRYSHDPKLFDPDNPFRPHRF